eukprot:CFRG2329T1
MSEERSTRRRKSKTQASASHYVGYVDDQESVLSIMKKFEELDKIKEKIKETQPEPENKGKNAVTDEDSMLTQEQLEEVFKRTSMFSARSFARDGMKSQLAMDDEEGWREDLFLRDREDEDDYFASWSDDDELWEVEPRAKKRRASGVPRERKPKKVKTSLSHKGVMLASGHRAAIRKREKWDDPLRRMNNPLKPTYVRIPKPLPTAWGMTFTSLVEEERKIPACSKYHTIDMKSTNIVDFVNSKMMCIYMDPPLCMPGEKPRDGEITMTDLKNLRLDRLVDSGFMFIWIEKEQIPGLFGLMSEWGLKYVENLCLRELDVNGKPAIRGSKYLFKSKTTCFIFRKVGDLELRHQRNPDVINHFVDPLVEKLAMETDGYVKRMRPESIYNVIETLLPDARCECAPLTNTPRVHCGKLLELWGPCTAREGWVTLANPSKTQKIAATT